MFEIVHAYDWYSGPRRGVADYRGRPHAFDSEWRDFGELDVEDTFLLTPVEPSTLDLVLEGWAIWRRWETALGKGETPPETHPALPEDRERHEELQRMLEGRLDVDPSRAVRLLAEFRTRHDPDWSGYGWPPLEVEWRVAP